MTWPCLRSNEFEFSFATFCTQSAEEFAARYETFHGCSSRVMGETGALGSVASLSTQAIDQLRLAYTRWNLGLKGTLKGDPQHYGVRVPLGDGSKKTWAEHRQRTDSGEVAIFSAHKGVNARVERGHSTFNLAVPNGLLTSYATGLYNTACDQPLEFDGRIHLGYMQSKVLKSLIDHLITILVVSPNSLKNPNVVACIEEHVMRVLLTVVPHKHARRDPACDAEDIPRIVKRAEDYMHQFAGEPLTLARICDHAGCSLRALQSAFRQFRGTTPIGALHEIRLEGAYRDLRTNIAPVTHIAHKWGFSNAGRFAVSYRAKYGEYPSETSQAKTC